MAVRVYLSPSKQPHNISALGLSEEALMAPVTEACRQELVRWGFEARVHQGASMQTAVAESNAWPANMHVAIHSNALSSGIGRGTETFYHSAGYPGEVLAACIHAEILAAFECVNRGIKDLSRAPMRFYEITETTMTAVLVETLFHSNAGEALLLHLCPERMGRAVADGIVTFCEWRYGAGRDALTARVQRAMTWIPKIGDAGEEVNDK